VEFGILGPLSVRRDGEIVAFGALKLRTLLIRLLLEHGHTVPIDRLVEDLWEGSAPAGSAASLRAYVSNLRRLLGDDGGALVTRGGGYALEIDRHAVDAERFAVAVETARAQRAESRHEAALARLEEALALWRGPALADVAYASFAQPTIRRLEELRSLAKEERAGALLAVGNHEAVIPDLESMIAVEPLRERPYRQLSLALYRAGRIPEAVEVHRRLRGRLADELGLDPSPRFDALAARILRRDPSLEVEADTVTRAPAHRSATDDPAAPGTPRTAHGVTGDGSTRVVGRVAERRQLRGMVERLDRAVGALVLLTGEPGIGKTTLLEDLEKPTGAAVHWAHCSQSGSAPGFWVWRQVVRSIVGSSPVGTEASALKRWPQVLQLLPDVAEDVEIRPPLLPDPTEARFALFEATAGFLSAVATVRPQMVLIDDLQWADAASLDLLAFLAERLTSVPILLAVSYRSATADRSPEMGHTLARLHRRDDSVELHLEGLSQQDVAELVAGTGRPVGAEHTASIHDRTGGNPFFVNQLVRFLDEDPRRLLDAAIPTGVRHVIANRVKLLPVSTQGLLEAAAIVGRNFDTRLVASVEERSTAEILEELDLAHAHELIEPEDRAARRHRFVHPLIHETLRDGLSPAKAARLHAATARALAGRRNTPPEQLAEHLWLAGDLAPEGAAVEALVAAADAAAASLAHEEAELLLRRALSLLVEGPGVDVDAEVSVRSRLLNLLTTVTGWSAADLSTVADRVWNLVDEVGLRPDLLPLWHLLWTGLTTRGEMERSRHVATELKRRAQQADNALFTHTADLLLGYLDTHDGSDPSAALEHIVAARAGLDHQPDAYLAATPEHLGVTARMIEVNARGLLDDPAAHAASAELIAYAERIGRPFSRMAAHLFAARSAAFRDDVQAAADWTETGLALCDAHGFAGARDLLIPINGWARTRLGGDADEQAIRIGQSVANIQASRGHVTPQFLLLHAEVLLAAGDPETAARSLERAREWVQLSGEHVYDALIANAEAAVQAAG
jgi:DNA-binding SARP family transcriptional activator